MFKNIIEGIEKISKQQSILVPINADNDGYIDKECPVNDCLFSFKVNETDWSNLFKDEAVYCPQCGHAAPSKCWWTREQVEEAKRQALNLIKSQIGNILFEGAREAQNRNRTGFIKLKIQYCGTNSRYIIMPISAQEEMEQKVTCDKCNARFSVVGIAFFCPCCGHNSIEKMFDNSLNKVTNKLNSLQAIQKILLDSGQRDAAAITCQSIVETSLSDCVTAFQYFCDKKYKAPEGEKKVPANSFQRIEFGNTAWKKVLGQGYDNWLGAEEYKELRILFQKRHLLQHSNGIVDVRYLEKSGDTNNNLGQRIVVTVSDVENLATMIKKIVTNIRQLTEKAGNT
ncbi:MAG: hypothetical protein HQK50_07205 [Oligoflexia bacterium]|nr:hypothetical protein [Oligoflexia bacterium]MBF0365341.1 hypothetical protein [Oligoflexia bacterium]